MKLLHAFLEFIEKKIFNKYVYHRNHCRKEGRCIGCGRYICEGCNAFANGRYGYCMDCAERISGYKNGIKTALPFKPLFKPYDIKRFEKSCNNRHYDYGEEY